MRLPEIARSEMDGIPLFSIDGPRPFTAHLMFRVGSYDETLRYRGITHLVEHLALHGLRGSEITFNGSVSSHTTVFTGQGHPDEVGDFLRSVCRSIHDLPLARTPIEAEVLRREEALRPFSYFDSIMWAYFGPRGPGAAGSREFGLDWLPAGDVQAWAAENFTRGNAAVLIVGKPPDTFGLELPDGAPRHYRAPERTKRVPEAPTLLDNQSSGVTWGTLIKHRKGSIEPAFFAGLDIVTHRLEDRLRHDLGHTYSVPRGWHRIDVDHMAATHGFDCEPTQSREAGLEHLQVMGEFLDGGPTQEELDRVIRVQRKAYEDHPHAAAQHHLFDEAESHLAGWGPTTSGIDYWNAMADLTPDEVMNRFQEAYRQSFTIADLPPDELASQQSLIEVSDEPLPGVPFYSRRRHRREQAAIVRIGPEGFSTLYAEGWINAPSDQIALVVVDDEGVQLFADTMTVGFESTRYSNSTLARIGPMRLGFAAALLLLGAFVGFALDAGLWGVFLAFVGSAAVVPVAQTSQADLTEIKKGSLTMQEAARRYTSEELILPERREEIKAPLTAR